MTPECTLFDAERTAALLQLEDNVLHLCIICASNGRATAKQQVNENCAEKGQSTVNELALQVQQLENKPLEQAARYQLP